jgi:hypothetical protein
VYAGDADRVAPLREVRSFSRAAHRDGGRPWVGVQVRELPLVELDRGGVTEPPNTELRDYCNWGTICRLPVGHEGPHAYGSQGEPPNTEALLATLRENLHGLPEALAALDAIASELERVRKFDHGFPTFNDFHVHLTERAEAAETELETVRAERDAAMERFEKFTANMAEEVSQRQARLDRAVEALREHPRMENYGGTTDAYAVACGRWHVEQRRAALAEIEESDVSG